MKALQFNKLVEFIGLVLQFEFKDMYRATDNMGKRMRCKNSWGFERKKAR